MQLKTSVFIPPDKLDFTEIDNTILDILSKNKNELCTKSLGNIINICTFKILDNTYQSSGSLKLDLLVRLESIRPKEGEVYTCKVSMLICSGILSMFHKIKVWISSTDAAGFKFVSNVYKKREKDITLDSSIKVRIKNVRYQK